MTASKQIDKLIAKTKDWRGDRLAEIRKLIHDVDPDVVEDWKWMGTPCWSHDGMYVIANPHKDKVKLTFFHGAQLPDPKKLFNAGLGGGKWRAIDFREGDRVNKSALKALLRAAVKYNAAHDVPMSKGSRANMPKKRPAKSAKGVKTAKTAKRSKKTAKPSRKSAAKSMPRKSSKPAAKQAVRRPARKPRLLSGGNPQIAKGEGDAPVQAYIAAAPGWKGAVAKRLDALIVDAIPTVRKAVKWNSPFYGIEGNGWFMSFHCMNKYVKVAFFKGGALSPPPPVASSDPHVRYFHVHEGEAIDESVVAGWIRQAAALPGWMA